MLKFFFENLACYLLFCLGLDFGNSGDSKNCPAYYITTTCAQFHRAFSQGARGTPDGTHFLENYVTSEGAVSHNVLYYQPFPITRNQERFYDDNYFE